MLANKKPKEIIYQTPKSPKPINESQIVINKNEIFNNMNNLIQDRYDDLRRPGSDIYIPNNPGKGEEEKNEKNYFNQGGFKLLQDGLKKGLVFESVDQFKESGDIFKESPKERVKESITESEDDIPEYDYLSQKIINSSL